MKSAFSNVLGNLSLGEDIKPAMDGLLSSVRTYLFDNLFPMIGNIFTGLASYIADVVVNTDWMAVINNALTAIRDALSTGISTYFGSDTTLVNDMFGFIIDGIPVVAECIKSAFGTVLESVNSVITTIQPLTQYVSDMFSEFIKGGEAGNIFNGVMSVVEWCLTRIADKINFTLEVFKPLIDMFIEYVTNGQLITDVTNVINDAIGFFAELITPVYNKLKPIIDGFIEYATSGQLVTDALNVVSETIDFLFQELQTIWETVGKPVWDAVMSTIQYVSDNWGSIKESILLTFQSLWDVCSTTWTTIGQPIWDMISFALSSVTKLFAELMPDIMTFFQEAIAGIQDTWNNHLKPVFEAIGDYLNNTIKPAFEFVWKTIIEPLITNVFDTIKRLWNGTLKPVFDGICDFLAGTFTGDWKRSFQGILNIVTGIFNAIQVAIEKPMDFARDIVESAINFIKDKFNFNWSLPHLSLPHFTISGSFSLNPPSVPSFGIDWYAKAMNDPIIMNSPTAFGINSLGQIMAGGEAGSEVVSGTDTLMRMIAAAVASQNNALLAVLVKILEAITSMDENMAESIHEALEGVGITLNNREFARLVKAVT